MFEQSQALGEMSKASLEEASSMYGISTWSYTYGEGSVLVNAYFDIEGSFEITL